MYRSKVARELDGRSDGGMPPLLTELPGESPAATKEPGPPYCFGAFIDFLPGFFSGGFS